MIAAILNDDSFPERLVALVERSGDGFLLRDLDPDAAWDETLPDRVHCPRSELVLTSAVADVDGDGTADRIAIVLKDGFSTDFETTTEGIRTTFDDWTTLYRWNERESMFEEEESGGGTLSLPDGGTTWCASAPSPARRAR